MEFHELLQQIDALNIPTDSYAITSSGTLAVRGLRKSNDLDVIVLPEVWEKLSKQYNVVNEVGYSYIDLGNIEILGKGSLFIDPSVKSAKDQIEEADVIEGRRYVKLDLVKVFKLQLGRDKDIVDVDLIDDWLKNTNT